MKKFLVLKHKIHTYIKCSMCSKVKYKGFYYKIEEITFNIWRHPICSKQCITMYIMKEI